MFAPEGGALRALTRPLRLALYRHSPLFEADVAAEIARLKAERPNAPVELANLKLARENMPSFRRAIWREAARRLAVPAPGSEEATVPQSLNKDGQGPSSPLPPTAGAAPAFHTGASGLSQFGDMQALALAGENRVHLWTPGGPGSLMETLHILADQGLLTVETDHDEAGDPTLVFHPVTPSALSRDLADA